MRTPNQGEIQEEKKMVSVNRVILAGNLARDPELRETGNGKSLTTFPVAVSRRWKNREGEECKDTGFFRVVVWNGMAQTCNRYLKKGRPVLVEGRLETRSYTGGDGQTQYITQIVGDHITFLNKAEKPRDDENLNDNSPAIM